MKKKYVIILSIILSIFLCCVFIGITYALWTLTNTQETTSSVATGCFSITYTDQDNISLQNTFPITDAKGLTLKPYQFTITNTCTLNSSYQVNLEILNTSTLDNMYVKTSFNGSTPYLLNSGTEVTPTITESSKAYFLTTGYLKAGESVSYNLRLWLTEDAPESIFNKSFSSKVTVISTVLKEYADVTGASKPELYQGLIPVTYDASGNTVVADVYKEWYNYATHNWANAVLVNCNDATIKSKYFNSDMSLKSSAIGTTMTDSDILEYYVWIPRYKYLLWNTENGSSDPQAISISFETNTDAKSTGSTNGTWLTHPAFTFGTTELNGIWVGKFENSGTTSNLTIKPNVKALTNLTVGDMFNATRNSELIYSGNYGILSSQVDTHMIKNMEWGATAYLSSSIYGRYNTTSTCISSGCQVWINNVGTVASGAKGQAITGCSGDTSTAKALYSMTSCPSGYDWKTLGVNASTTGNQYGIYDMAGGTWEYIMASMVDSSGDFFPSSSGLSKPENKYYDIYSYQSNLSINSDHVRGKIGDATKETLKTFGNINGGWYSDYVQLVAGNYNWFTRGGNYLNSSSSGLFSFSRGSGINYNDVTFRSVLTAQ